ncbi:MAG: hypothetical protein IKL89_08625 [Clostridia bacterium]|nr:hypothetical protein [Clostridia bacterium]
MYFDKEGLRLRQKRAWNAWTELILPLFDEKGNWLGEKQYDIWSPAEVKLPSREILWGAVAMLGSDNAEAAKRAVLIMEHMTDPSTGYHGVRGSFDMHAAINILLRHREKLSDTVVDMIYDGIRDMMRKVVSPDVNYSGINDNFPSMDCFSALVGGPLVGDTAAFEKGKYMLSELRAMLTRRGFLSEYNSPTYTSISLHAMADIAELCEDGEMRELALQCEERIWADLILHYHPGISVLSGPYSRTYTVDCAGHEHAARNVLWAALGDELVPVNMMNTALTSLSGEEGEIMHNSNFHLQSNAVWQVSGDYHLPEYLVEALRARKFPFTFTGTTECRCRSDIDAAYPDYVFPGGNYPVTTYMQPDYTLGCALRDFSTGSQTNSFQITYRKKAPVTRQADIGTVFTKYLIEKGVGCEPKQLDAHYIYDSGRKICLQKENSALVAYKPKHWADENVTRMALAIQLPAMYSAPEEVYIGGERVDTAGEGTLYTGELSDIVIRDGNVWMGFRPLAVDCAGEGAGIRVERDAKFLSLLLVNHDGAPIDLTVKEALCCRNGFVAEIRSAEEIGGLAEMRALLAAWQIEDRASFLDTNSRERYISAGRGGVEFRLCWGSISEDIKYATVDGKDVPAPLFRADGFDESRLPFLK